MKMKRSQIVLLLTALTTAGLSGATQAEGLYGSAMIGKSDQAQDSEPYGSNIAVDATFPSQFSTGDGNVGTLGVGYSFSNQFRVEARLGFHNGEFNSREQGMGARAGEDFVLNGEIESKTLTVEGFYDISAGTAFKPYVKAGLGVARNRYSARLGGTGAAGFDAFDGTTDGFYDAYDDQESTEFTWNVGAGVSYAINKQISLVGEYQYVSFGDASTGQDSFTDGFRVEDAAAHEVQLGLKYNF
jgi:opacity protein-like surface antigen